MRMTGLNNEIYCMKFIYFIIIMNFNFITFNI